MLSAALRMMATRSCHGVAAHVGAYSLAAAMASFASCCVPWANFPRTTLESIGERSSLKPEPVRASPLTKKGCSWPSSPRARSTASSYRRCSSSLSAVMVA